MTLALPWRLTALRVAAYATAGLTILVLLAGIASNAAIGNRAHLEGVFTILSFLTFPAMGLLIVRQRPTQRVGWILLAIGLNMYVTFVASDYARLALVRHPGLLPFGEALAWISGWNWIPLALLMLLFLPLLFPNGRLPSRRWWIVIGLGLAFGVLAFVGNAFTPGPPDPGYPDVINPLGLPGHEALFTTLQNVSLLPGIGALLGSLASIVVRYRRGDGIRRRQLRWFLFALCLATIPFLLHGAIPDALDQLLTTLTIPLVPISIAIAVLRYRLYDIDLVINRTLVYSALAIFIGAVYVAVVVGVGAVVGAGGRSSFALSILATAIVAVAFQPLRTRIQRLANRLVYGKRATPYEVMAEFASGIAGTLAVDQVLPKTAEVAGRGMGASAARVVLALPDASERVSTWPAEAGQFAPSLAVPVLYQGETIGEIAVRKPPGEPITAGDRRLLTDLAAQTGLVLHNVRLTAQLQVQLEQLAETAKELADSRERIIKAEEDERRRLDEEIRAGVDRDLESIRGHLEVVEGLLEQHPDEASHRLDELVYRTQEALDRLRELARGIFPPLLSERGLVAALHAQLRKTTVPVSLETANELESRRFDTEVETAVYFACLEALRRAMTSTVIRLDDSGDVLRFSVSGLAADGDIGASRDRIAAVGGSLRATGNRWEGQIPLSPQLQQVMVAG